MLTIIVPVYNVEKYLARCIESILAQTYMDLEIILINDGSTDNSLSFCQYYADLDKRIQLFSKENGGQVEAWKFGLSVSNGEYIAFLDSDDWYDKNFCKKLIEPFYRYDIDMSACAAIKRYDGGRSQLDIEEINKYEGIHVISEEDKNNFFNSDYCKIFKFYRWNKIIKKSLILNNLKYANDKVQVFEDNCIIIPCLLDVNKIYFVAEYLYNYYQRSGSTMNTFSIKTIEANRIVQNTMIQIFHDKQYVFDRNKNLLNLVLYSLSGIIQSKDKISEKINLLKLLQKDIDEIDLKNTVLPNKKYTIGMKLLKAKRFYLLICFYEIYKKLRGKHAN